MKVCTRCKIEKPKAEFNRSAGKKDGLYSHCKLCKSETARIYREANPEKVLALLSKWRSENRERISDYGREWYASDPERKVIYAREWRKINPGYSKEYREANPEKIAANDRKRRALKSGAEGSHTTADVNAIFDGQRGKCANCEKKLFKSGANKFHIDHIQPLSKGGSNWPGNLQCLCPTCNVRKSAKDPLAWAKEQGRLL